MILVFVTNECFGEVADLSFDGKVGYRNPRYIRDYDKPEKCEAVYIHGNWPKAEALYKDKLIKPAKKEIKVDKDDFPKDKGAGWFELSNGESVRGKKKAIEAENNL